MHRNKKYWIRNRQDNENATTVSKGRRRSSTDRGSVWYAICIVLAGCMGDEPTSSATRGLAGRGETEKKEKRKQRKFIDKRGLRHDFGERKL